MFTTKNNIKYLVQTDFLMELSSPFTEELLE